MEGRGERGGEAQKKKKKKRRKEKREREREREESPPSVFFLFFKDGKDGFSQPQSFYHSSGFDLYLKYYRVDQAYTFV